VSDPRPLAVFDSGLGGLTVLRALRARLPSESVLYLGDTARVPYGTRADDTVLRYAREAAAFLVDREVKALVVACNTVSAVALEALAAEVPVPVVGVLDPGAREACRRTRSGVVGVIGTAATIRSDAYARRIRELRPDARVLQAACPLFVPLAEEGWDEGDVPRLVAERYLAGLRREGVDTLVLGCTHYPILRPVVLAVMGDGVTLVDSADSVADEVTRLLADHGLAAPDDGDSLRDDHFFVTDSSERFREVGERFLGGALARLEQVSLPVSHVASGAV
jgi:glutamate racemase